MDYWKEKTLCDVLTLQRGFDLSVSKRINGPYPVIASTGPVGTNEKPMVKGPGVVIGRSGSIGGGQYIKSDFWPLNTTLWVKDYKSNDVLFCYYLLKSLDFSRYNAGSGVPTLNRNHIHPIPVKIPPLPEQHAIAQILSSLDDKIELNTQMNETLEAMAQALFKSWFVDFDPVRAKMAGRAPEGMDAETAALFPDEMEVVDGREVPNGWGIGQVGEVCKVITDGSHFSPKEVANGEHSIATVKNMNEFDFDVSTCKSIAKEEYDILVKSGCKPEKHDILISKDGTMGIVHKSLGHQDVVLLSSIALFRPNDMYFSDYLYCYFMSQEFQDILPSYSSGSVLTRLVLKDLKIIPILLPNSKIIQIFSQLFAPLFQRIIHNCIETRTLATIRDTLLPKLISGEIRIDNPEQFLFSEDVT